MAYVQDASWKELGPVMETIGRRMRKHRERNRGRIPLEVFIQALFIAGVFAVAEIIVEVVDEEGLVIGYALKLRDGEKEIDYRGLYQVPGATVTMEGLDEAFLRAAREIYRDPEIARKIVEMSADAGLHSHDEPLRGATSVCKNLVFQVTEEEVAQFHGTWKIFSTAQIREGDERVVPHQISTVLYVADKKRPPFADCDNDPRYRHPQAR